MTKAILQTILFGFGLTQPGHSFNLPNIFKPPSLPKIQTENISSKEAEILKAISYTAGGKNADTATQIQVSKLVRDLETNYPPSENLLSDPEEAKILDGDWYLQYTRASDDAWVPVDASEGESKIETRKFEAAGSVSGGGIPVDASKNIPRQSFDIANCRVQNEIMTGIGLVTVAGRFRQSSTVPTRAVVAFDTAKIDLNFGPTLDISIAFKIRAAIKGTDEAGWVETTYCSNNVRIGRGNKGSMFVLTRDIDAAKN